jgi:hypothetical protein
MVNWSTFCCGRNFIAQSKSIAPSPEKNHRRPAQTAKSLTGATGSDVEIRSSAKYIRAFLYVKCHARLALAFTGVRKIRARANIKTIRICFFVLCIFQWFFLTAMWA